MNPFHVAVHCLDWKPEMTAFPNLLGVGGQTVSSPAYRWRGATRRDSPHILFQLTLEGCGVFMQGRRGGAAMLHQHDRDPFEHGREAPVGLRPRDRDHQRAVLGALHARNLGLDDRSELASVQMPPAARRPLMQMHALGTGGATPERLLGLDVDDNLLALQRQIDLRDVPRLLQTQYLFV